MMIRSKRRPAFTLVELLVVIAIIALLLAALLPAFGVIRGKAKQTLTTSMFGALNTGIETYRAEQSLGAGMPPSMSDNKNSPHEITLPSDTSISGTERADGANLLAMALVGFDGLGTPGFKDLTKDADAEWWNNQNADQENGLYALDPTTGKEKHPRYGPYVDDKMREHMSSLPQLADKGRIVSPLEEDQIKAKLPFFIDAWDMPILYYKASPGNNRMVNYGTSKPGIFRQEDNAVITGTKDGGNSQELPGIDFGASDVNDGVTVVRHFLGRMKEVDPATTPVSDILEKPEWQTTFPRFIVDAKIKTRPTPVQANSYLLISAGADSRYGTSDDVTNWTRETN